MLENMISRFYTNLWSSLNIKYSGIHVHLKKKKSVHLGNKKEAFSQVVLDFVSSGSQPGSGQKYQNYLSL